jgi:hypothetical protein
VAERDPNTEARAGIRVLTRLVDALTDEYEAADTELQGERVYPLLNDAKSGLAALEQAGRALEQEREKTTALKELSGYVRSHLAGNDADPELKWALDLADEALASSPGDPAAETETSG